MTIKLSLLVSGLCSIALLTGCSESATLGQGLNAIVTEVSKGVQAGLGTPSQTQIDWTPFLKSMQVGCDYPSMASNVPAKYKPSVENVYRKGDPNSEGDEVVYYFNLKDATAFGYPIVKEL